MQILGPIWTIVLLKNGLYLGKAAQGYANEHVFPNVQWLAVALKMVDQKDRTVIQFRQSIDVYKFIYGNRRK